EFGHVAQGFAAEFPCITSWLKSWMIPFHGVATKYLTNYLGWRRLLERYKAQLNPLIFLGESLGYTGVQQLTQT
ncbi:MAG: hypothetical protein I8H81_03750, partial [Pseudomonadales bacterium]|nr:hypothetical protein [Pseudomonadales bacterium]